VDIVTGAVVIALVAAALVYASTILGWFSGPTDAARYRVSLASAEGISEGTDVRIAGIPVGHVSWLTLNPETFGAETELTVEGPYQFPSDSLAVVSSEGLLGGTYVEIIPGTASGTLAPGGQFRTAEPEFSIVDLLLDRLNNNGSR
jgi:phospholipid/cholesterol/gamma-HCH transport system substrate-binding protein